MRAALQRVSTACVRTGGEVFSSIGRGLLIYLGLHRTDGVAERDWMIRKILQARLFEEPSGRLMTRNVLEETAEILVVSQVTLYGDLRKGNRPDMSESMKPAEARPLYENFVEEMRRASGLKIATGSFGALMSVESCNEGPVTLLLDTASRKGEAF